MVLPPVDRHRAWRARLEPDARRGGEIQCVLFVACLHSIAFLLQTQLAKGVDKVHARDIRLKDFALVRVALLKPIEAGHGALKERLFGPDPRALRGRQWRRRQQALERHVQQRDEGQERQAWVGHRAGFANTARSLLRKFWPFPRFRAT